MPHFQGKHSTLSFHSNDLSLLRNNAGGSLRQDDLVALLQQLVGADGRLAHLSNLEFKLLLEALVCHAPKLDLALPLWLLAARARPVLSLQ